jgi:hypothetical protein
MCLGTYAGIGVWCLTETQPLPSYVVERLGYTRFLHQEGIDQARRPHPMSSAAILSFHDAAELFYFLALDHMAVHVNPKSSFEDYWRELSKVVPNLSGRREMERLNRVRVNLKHRGSIPGTQQVADARTDVDAFLAANTQAVFGVGTGVGTGVGVGVVPQSRSEPKSELRRRRQLATARKRWACSHRHSTSCSTRSTPT